jgi:AAA family ATP:ADP antiporter
MFHASGLTAFERWDRLSKRETWSGDHPLSADRESGPARLLARVAKVEPNEIPAVVTAFLLFFCVLGGYFAVRPVRETVGTILGADRVADLFALTWFASIAIVPIYGALCARFRRSAFLPWIYGFVALCLAALGFTFRADESNVLAGKFFFVFISVLNLFMVSVFWSFLLELFDKGQVKRLFGVIAAGGTAGALGGPLMTDLLVGFLGNSGILFVGAGMFALAVLFQRALLRIWARRESGTVGGALAHDRPIGGNPFAGFALVFKSPYLLGIASFVILLAAVNTFLYFAQLRIVSETFADTAQRTRVFSRLDYTVQSLTIISQLFFTGRIASRFGIGSLLTAVPVAMFAGFLLLGGFHTFGILALVMITRRVGEYAFVRPGREMLFSRVDTESKYKAKNLIDVPVYRGGDAIVAQVDKALSAAGLAPANVALLGAGVAAAWAVNGFLLGRSHKAAEDRRIDPAGQGRPGIRMGAP